MLAFRKAERRGLVEAEAKRIIQKFADDPYYEAQSRAQLALLNGDRKKCDFYRSVARSVARKTGVQDD